MRELFGGHGNVHSKTIFCVVIYASSNLSNSVTKVGGLIPTSSFSVASFSIQKLKTHSVALMVPSTRSPDSK